MAGRYSAVNDALLDGKKVTASLRRQYIVSLVGALSFVGRVEEANQLFELHQKKLSKIELIASRFFLLLGWTRRSEYETAGNLLSINQKLKPTTALEEFYIHQGTAFFLYFSGKIHDSTKEAMLARDASLAAKNSFARCLATDLLGHCRAVGGEIHAGLQSLKEAEHLAERLGNSSLSNSIAISREIYETQYGLVGGSPEKLEKRLKKLGTEDNYSQANVALELARQQCLRGQFMDTANTLAFAAPLVYANQNRRQEIVLNLRLAELDACRGKIFQARHYLWFSRRVLHREVDASFELAALGLERKLALSESLDISAIDAKWHALRSFANTRDENLQVRLGLKLKSEARTEDLVHMALFAAEEEADLGKRLEIYLNKGYLPAAARSLGIKPGERSLAVLLRGLGLLVQSPENMHWLPDSVSRQQYKILQALRAGREVSKANLVKSAWGYEYDMLRHDSMVYAAISGLRKSLGPAAAWLEVTEHGYRFCGEIIFCAEKSEESTQEIPATNISLDIVDANLNHRQLEILSWLQGHRFVSVQDCCKRFGVSEITALRDLSGLVKGGHVTRIGKARATRYAKQK